VLVEGHINHPHEARRALDMGATAVVVGSAITRPGVITARFVQATKS
jgi:putative N-acetylmannosamine-6-phosphate epimerase